MKSETAFGGCLSKKSEEGRSRDLTMMVMKIHATRHRLLHILILNPKQV